MSAPLKTRARWLAIGLCGWLSTSLALAQPQINQPQQRENQPARPGASSQLRQQSENPEVDRFLASCLLAKTQAQAEISQLAQEKSQDAEVKQFAQQIISDHQEMAQKLQPIAQSTASESGAAPGQTRPGADAGQTRPGATAGQARPGAAARQSTIEERRQRLQQQAGDPTRRSQRFEAAGSDRGALDQLTSIERQIVDQATQALRQSLQEKSATEFDQCYLAAEVACHMQLKAALTVLQQQAPGQELKQFAQEHVRTVDQHLQRAQQLLAAQSGSDRRAAARAGQDAQREGESQFPR